MIDHSTVVALFKDRDTARAAVNELRRLGFLESQIGVLSRDPAAQAVTGETATATVEGSKWEEGAATGVAAGAGVGALWALGIAAGVLPAIGPVIAGGLLASVLASAAGGAAIAGVVGALIGLGIPEEEVKYYQRELKAGRYLVTVKTGSRLAEAERLLRRHGAYDFASVQADRAAAKAEPHRHEVGHAGIHIRDAPAGRCGKTRAGEFVAAAMGARTHRQPDAICACVAVQVHHHRRRDPRRPLVRRSRRNEDNGQHGQDGQRTRPQSGHLLHPHCPEVANNDSSIARSPGGPAPDTVPGPCVGR